MSSRCNPPPFNSINQINPFNFLRRHPLARSRQRRRPPHRTGLRPPPLRRPPALGRRSPRPLDRPHLCLPVARYHHLHRRRIPTKTLRQNYPPVTAPNTGQPCPPPPQHP